MVGDVRETTPLPEQIADALPALIAYVDRGQRYRWLNRGYADWFALTRDELLGRSVEEVLGEASYAAVRGHVEAALAGETVRFEARVPYRQTEHRRVAATYVPHRDDAGQVLGYYALVFDRTEADRQDQRISDILDVFGEGFCAFDAQWRFTWCNSAAAIHAGIRREDVLGRSLWDVAPVADTALADAMRAVAERGEPMEIDLPSVIKSDAIMAVRIFPFESGVAISFRDITQRVDRLRREQLQTQRLADLERRRAFLLELADSLHVTDQPGEVTAAAAKGLGVFLGVDRVGYGEVDAAGLAVRVLHDWTNGVVASLGGATFPLDNFGPPVIDILRRGEVVAIADIAADPRSQPYVQAYADIGVRAQLVVPLLRQGRLEGVLYLHAGKPRAWEAGDVGLVHDVAARTAGALARARSERALRESEARFRAMADSAPSPVWVTLAAGPIDFVNQAFAELVGQPATDLTGDFWLQIIHPDDLPAVAAQRAAARASQPPESYGFEARFRDSQGQWLWMRAAAKPRFDAAGAFQGYVGMAVDVTDARAADDRHRLLINELNHRVKNTLATVQSLARQSWREGMTAKDARDQLTARLLALSAAHNVLTRENWESADLADIVSEAVRPYEDRPEARIHLAGPSVRLAPHVALAVSMALHELATNAVKYGSLSLGTGCVELSWSRDAGAIDLTWRERDGPVVIAPTRKGFGSRLLGQGLAGELGAPATLDYAPDGLVCTLRAPIAAEPA